MSQSAVISVLCHRFCTGRHLWRGLASNSGATAILGLLKGTWLEKESHIILHLFREGKKKKGHLIKVPAPTCTLFWTLNVNDDFKFLLKSIHDFSYPF